MTKFLALCASRKNLFVLLGLSIVVFSVFGVISEAFAHGVTAGDKGYIQEITGALPVPFIYLGAKHMITGYDHLLFLLGVIFFLYRFKDVGIYVTLFAVGHVVTLLGGVLLDISINAFIIDAIIGFSIVYKALDNMGAYQRWFKFQPNTKVATLIFGFFHGLGLATKIIDYELSADGLLINLVSFNIGVELGQVLALALILILITYWRRFASFMRYGYSANTVLMMLGFVFVGYQLTGYFVF